MKTPLEFSYDIYISAPAARVWRGLVDAKMTRQYVYGTSLEAKLEKGAAYAYLAEGNFRVVDGEILDVQPEKRLAMTWNAHWDEAAGRDKASRVTYELSSPTPETTKLRLVHDAFEGATPTYKSSIEAWPLMMSSLKSLIETGKPLPTPPMA